MDDSLSQVDADVVAQLRRMPTGGSIDLYSRLVGIFAGASAEALAQLRAALDSSSAGQAASICHKLKSSAANIGALAFARQLGQLEQVCRHGEIGDARDLFGPLERALPRLVAELGRA